MAVGPDPHLLGAVAPQLDVDRLAADDVSAAGHHVGRGDSTGVGHTNAGVERVDRIECPDDALDRSAPLIPVAVGLFERSRGDTQMRMAIDQSGNDDLACGVNHPGSVGDLDLVGGAHRDNFSATDDHRAGGNRLAAGRQDPGSTEGDQVCRFGRSRHGNRQGQAQRTHTFHGDGSLKRSTGRRHRRRIAPGRAAGAVWWTRPVGFSSSRRPGMLSESGQGSSYDRLHLLQAGPADPFSVLLPVSAVEKLE